MTFRLRPAIKDPEALSAYAKLAGPAIWAAAGRNLVRGTPAKTLEAGMDLRTVVIEFDSVASAITAEKTGLVNGGYPARPLDPQGQV
jgi:uncharacterized protein (DUF1330 family)